MSKIVIAVLLSLLGPGLGQLYNRDFRKGTIILLITAFLVLAPSYWVIRKVAPLLPDPKTQVISQEMVQTLALQAIGKNRHLLNYISFLFLGLWAYSITQAYFRAKEIYETTEKPDNNDMDSFLS